LPPSSGHTSKLTVEQGLDRRNVGCKLTNGRLALRRAVLVSEKLTVRIEKANRRTQPSVFNIFLNTLSH
jgi:hypothetical protein